MAVEKMDQIRHSAAQAARIISKASTSWQACLLTDKEYGEACMKADPLLLWAIYVLDEMGAAKN